MVLTDTQTDRHTLIKYSIVERLAQNVTTGYYCTEYVRVFPIGHIMK